MYNNNGHKVLAYGKKGAFGTGYHMTSELSEAQADILQDMQAVLSLVEYTTNLKLQELADAIAAYDKKQAEKLNYNLYIARTNPGKSGNEAREWLEVNAR
jgi:Ser/Thr protein kinase RdoA (MazF antagonist)